MSFSMKWKLRSFGSRLLTLPISFSALVICYFVIEMERFRMFPHFFYEANFQSLKVFNKVYWHHFDQVVSPHFKWLLVAMIADFVIRRYFVLKVSKA